MDTRFHNAVKYAVLSLRHGGITKERAEGGYQCNLRWAWYEAWYGVGEYTACYPENLQKYLTHAQGTSSGYQDLFSAHKRAWERGYMCVYVCIYEL